MATARRIILPLAIVVAILAGSELAVRAVASRLDAPLVWLNREAQNKVTAMDALRQAKGGSAVVFVGSSMMNAAEDPALTTKLLGLKHPAFNAAIDGADIRSLEFWTLHVVVPRLRPRVVVIGVSSREFNDNGLNQRGFERKFFDSEAVRRLDGRLGTLARVEAWLDDHSDLLRYRTVLRRPAEARAVPRPTDVDALGVAASIRPFQRRPYGFGKVFRRRITDLVLNDYAIGGVEVAALDRLVRGLDRLAIKVVLVEMPVTDDVIPMHPRGQADYASFRRAFAAFVATHDVVSVDMRTPFPDTAEFVDPLHLDARGSRQFTQDISGLIRRAFLSPRSP
jgi:hypothetical protein